MNDFQKIKEEIEAKTESLPNVTFETSFEYIVNLTENQDVLVSIPKYNIKHQPARLNKNDSGGFTIDIEGIVSDMSESYEVELLINEKTYQIKDLFISMRGSSFKRNEHNEFFSGKLTFTGQIHELELIDSEETPAFNRFIIPTGTSQLDYYIKSTAYQDDTHLHAYGRIVLYIEEKEFILYEKQRHGKYYFIVDSTDIIDSDKFSDICHSIMIGFGFLSANFIQNEAYYLKSNQVDFEKITGFSYLQLRPSINSRGTCNPIYSNPYGYTRDEQIIEKIGKKLDVFDSIKFSALCSKIHKYEDYAVLIMLLLEANDSSLILRPAGYSVALEKITNIIVEENKGLKPIPDKKLSKDFRKELTDVLNRFKDDIKEKGNDDSIIILEKNINKINNPTNRDKLVKPFEIYNIKLSKSDLESIDNRNNFLHGRKIKTDEETEDYMKIYEVSLRLNNLINKLILKHTGYSGYIINHLKHNDKSFDYEIEKELFEEI